MSENDEQPTVGAYWSALGSEGALMACRPFGTATRLWRGSEDRAMRRPWAGCWGPALAN